MNANTPRAAFSQALDEIWQYCATLIAHEVGYQDYVERLRTKHARLPADLRDDTLTWPLVSCMSRQLWRRTPHPAARYAPGMLSVPGRNDPCSCGSLRKYKQCCLEIEQNMPPLDMNPLPMVLDSLPKRRWAELAGSHVSMDQMFDAAWQMNADGRAKDTCTLLEPWFVHDTDIRAEHEELFDMLLDAYTELHKPRKKAQLLSRAISGGDQRMRSAALQRTSTMRADAGDYAAAWQMFGEAQRADPQSPSLAHLEITLLISQGDHVQARERARFWVHRLTAMRDPALAELVEFMREVAAHGEQALTRRVFDNQPGLRELVESLQAAPPITSSYTLSPNKDDAGPLEPTPALEKALLRWHSVASPLSHSPLAAPAKRAEMAAWLPLLREQPLLWNAFEVLDTIVETMREWRMDLLVDTVVLPVLDRAERLLREVLTANHAQNKRLEWGWLENRPALNLIGHRIAIDGGESLGETELARLEWLVLVLNPSDNQGFRHSLVRGYLHVGRVADALALCERYSDDFAAMQYNHALALFAAGQAGLAVTALAKAAEAYPKLLSWLLKTNPKPPARAQWGVSIGGDDEAWIYRSETLALWQQLGAMEWLRGCSRTFKKSR
ncbi:SEC-C metal-binding domain-containing protein [Rhodanobacter sp. AS-Z3]|uniref:YecA family protein n=1 Tax=Rhodanobacter sp. AS-Z3 TaxID=3031330 RepID=UPI002479EFB4|nr:SEC-C metal-binding domain-containing protein [Rhodanobacter sp. AS-Z3]WEN15169.1 SEC-C metal-binding domain-containing protein [Rhodanobacter sp. AS-Z3]